MKGEAGLRGGEGLSRMRGRATRQQQFSPLSAGGRRGKGAFREHKI